VSRRLTDDRAGEIPDANRRREPACAAVSRCARYCGVTLVTVVARSRAWAISPGEVAGVQPFGGLQLGLGGGDGCGKKRCSIE
jgi:hypothetical protein